MILLALKMPYFFTKLFGSEDLAKRTIYNHQRKIKQKIRSLMDLERISFLSHKFLDNQIRIFVLTINLHFGI